MRESPSEESDVCALSAHYVSSVECQSSVVESACEARQNSSSLIPSRAVFLTAALPGSSLRGSSIDLQGVLTLFLSRMDKMESNIANVTKTSNLLHERITGHEQDKVSLHPDSSEYQRDDLVEEVRLSSEELQISLLVK